MAETAALAAGHALDNLSDWLDYHPPLGSADKQKLDRAASLTPQLAAEMQEMEAVQSEPDNELTRLLRMRVPKNPLISPMYASDEQLRALPPVWFVVSERDFSGFSSETLILVVETRTERNSASREFRERSDLITAVFEF